MKLNYSSLIRWPFITIVIIALVSAACGSNQSITQSSSDRNPTSPVVDVVATDEPEASPFVFQFPTPIDKLLTFTPSPLPPANTPTIPISEKIFIPAGEFQKGCDPEHNIGIPCESSDAYLQTSFLEAFFIDATEVTNAQYDQCVRAGVCTSPVNTHSTTRPSYYGNMEYADYPVVWVDWYQADTYCNWVNGRLPSGLEWEKAARGSNDTRPFPWGEQPPDCKLANFNYCTGDTTRVGSYPSGASPYGILDLAGNVQEWIDDWQIFVVQMVISEEYIVHGGAMFSNSQQIRIASRLPGERSLRSINIGFRCVIPLEPDQTPTP